MELFLDPIDVVVIKDLVRKGRATPATVRMVKAEAWSVSRFGRDAVADHVPGRL